jgi:hypothetical protein
MRRPCRAAASAARPGTTRSYVDSAPWTVHAASMRVHTDSTRPNEFTAGRLRYILSLRFRTPMGDQILP